LVFACEGHCGQKAVIPTYSGNDLLRDCTDESNQVTWSFCMGFISGTWAGAILVGNAYHPDKPNFVIPPEANLSQVKDVVVKFLKDHAAQRHLSAGVLLLLALKEAFPPDS
jgi:hypothetical protein